MIKESFQSFRNAFMRGLLENTTFRNAEVLKTFLVGTATLATVAHIVVFISTQYFGLHPLSAIYFIPSDGWCPPGHPQPIGVHCFGDFGLPTQISGSENPWDPKGIMVPYSATGFLLFLPFKLIMDATGSYGFALIVYMAAGIISLSSAGLYATKELPLRMKLLGVCLSLALFPGLLALDRGNSIMFAVPLFLLLFESLRSEKWNRAGLAIILLSLLKPQFVVLLLIFITVRLYKMGVTFLLVAASLNVGAFAFWWKSFPNNIFDFLVALGKYQHQQSLATFFPENASFTVPFFSTELVAKVIRGEDWKLLDGYWTLENSNFLAIGIGTLLLVGTMLTHKRRTALVNAICLTAVASFSPSVSYSYYLVFCLPICALLVRDGLRDPEAQSLIGQGWSGRLFLSTLLLSLVRIPLPITIDANYEKMPLTTAELLPILFMAFVISTFFNRKTKIRSSPERL